MMTIFKSIPVVSICLAALWGMAHGAEHPASLQVIWPSGVEAKIGEVLASKERAFRASPKMRTDGVEAAFVGKCMDEIAAALGEAGQRPALMEVEGTDLKAKIALWALDRKARPGEYARMAAAYVDAEPVEVPVAGPDGRIIRKPRPHIIPPRMVTDRDAVEAQRWPLEYLFFVPPAGRAHDDSDAYRVALADGLRRIGNPRSLLMFQRDLEMQLEAWPPKPAVLPDYHVGEAVVAIQAYRSVKAFEVMAAFWVIPSMRARFQGAFEAEFFRTHKLEKLAEQRDGYTEWQKIADREWTTAGQREMAIWVKALPVPERLPDR